VVHNGLRSTALDHDRVYALCVCVLCLPCLRLNHRKREREHEGAKAPCVVSCAQCACVCAASVGGSGGGLGVGGVEGHAQVRGQPRRSELCYGAAGRRRQAGEEGGREALSIAETISDRAHRGRTLWQGTGSAAGGETQRGLQLYRHHAHRISAGSAIAGRDENRLYSVRRGVSRVSHVVYRIESWSASLLDQSYLQERLGNQPLTERIPQGARLPRVPFSSIGRDRK
jgi:hypothetical protein